jgi:hypothetical protein
LKVFKNRDWGADELKIISFVSTGDEAPSAIDGHVLTFGDSGYALYTAMRIPASLNWTFLILESDEDVVELGAASTPWSTAKTSTPSPPGRSPCWPP